MPTNRSHLTPTSIVDKNGVITSRLKKPTGTVVNKQAALLPVNIAAEAPSAVPVMEQLTALLRGFSRFETRDIELLDEDDPETLPLAIRLITTGKELSRDRAFGTMAKIISEVHRARLNHGGNWRDKCEYSLSPFNKHELIAAWHVGDLVTETGYTENPYDVQARTLGINTIINMHESHRDLAYDEDYWRGLAITAMSGMDAYTLSRENLSHIREFAAWSAHHPNPARIIRMVEERQSLNVHDLKDILKQQDSHGNALRDGAL